MTTKLRGQIPAVTRKQASSSITSLSTHIPLFTKYPFLNESWVLVNMIHQMPMNISLFLLLQFQSCKFNFGNKINKHPLGTKESSHSSPFWKSSVWFLQYRKTLKRVTYWFPQVPCTVYLMSASSVPSRIRHGQMFFCNFNTEIFSLSPEIEMMSVKAWDTSRFSPASLKHF